MSDAYRFTILASLLLLSSGLTSVLRSLRWIRPANGRKRSGRSEEFKREPDASKWNPAPCRPLWPRMTEAARGDRLEH